MRWTLALAAASVVASPLSAQDPDRKVEGSGNVPAGWNVRADRGRPITSLKFEAIANGFHFTTGPAVTVWRDGDATPGAFHAVAEFTQTKAPAHAEAFGMFIGGKNLKDSTATFTYFIIRGDGKFVVKKMAGQTATNVAGDWAEHPAITKQDAAGKQTNKVEVSATKDGKVTWKVNGKDVYSGSLTPAELNGIVGLRVNHNLDVNVIGFEVHQL